MQSTPPPPGAAGWWRGAGSDSILYAMGERRPNIVFVFTDQQRSTAVGCAGVEDVRTPHLDGLAAQGTRFTNAVANTPVCAAARASILTGLHVLSHELVTNDIALRTDVPHVAQCLNAAGYRCGYVGKWHLEGPDRGVFIPPGPRRRGFDDFWAVANCTHDYNNAHYYLNDDPEPYWHRGYEPFSQADIAVEYLESRGPRSAEQPFCLFVSFGTPHCPYGTAPPEYEAMYANGRFRLLPNVKEDEHVQREHEKWGMHPVGASVREIVGCYYAHITATDAAFGRILAAIDRLGLAGDTIVVFTSDHGDMLFSHGHGWKSKPWRESVGVPMVVRWPGRVPAGRVTDGPIGLVDMMPTLLHLAGAAAPASVEGLDLSRFVSGDDAAAPAEEWINFPCISEKASVREWRGVVTRRHTYVRTRQEPWLLYDDRADPFQLRNLVGESEHAALRGELDGRVRSWLAKTSDAFATSRDVAHKFAPTHVGCVPPYWFNEKVKAGSKDPSLRRYRRKGEGL